jgi:hypothetical protein
LSKILGGKKVFSSDTSTKFLEELDVSESIVIGNGTSIFQ